MTVGIGVTRFPGSPRFTSAIKKLPTTWPQVHSRGIQGKVYPNLNLKIARGPKTLMVLFQIEPNSPDYERFHALQKQYKHLSIYPDSVAQPWNYFQLYIKIPFVLREFSEVKLAELAQQNAPFSVTLQQPFARWTNKGPHLNFKVQSPGIDNMVNKLSRFFGPHNSVHPMHVQVDPENPMRMLLNKSFMHVSKDDDARSILKEIEDERITLNVKSLVLKNVGEGLAEKLPPKYRGSYRETWSQEYPLRLPAAPETGNEELVDWHVSS